jgi:predicted cupin superfamily sugar epimerase
MAQTLDARRIIALLGLEPHPEEGGFFIETWRSERQIPAEALGGVYDGPRSAGTAIYYLLTPETFSALHRLKSEEVFHFYMGDPVEMLHLYPDGRAETVLLGPDLVNGQTPQVVVPAGVWQGARLAEGGQVALLGCTVSPGFEFIDYEHGRRADLLEGWPAAAPLVEALTTA